MAMAQDIGNSSSVADVTVMSTVGSSTAGSAVVSAAPAGAQSVGGARQLSSGMQFAGASAFGTSSQRWGVSSSDAGTSSTGVSSGLPSGRTLGMSSGRSSFSAQQLSALSATSSKNLSGSTKTTISPRSGGGGVYSAGFADSTKGTAAISPPEGLSSNLFNFAPGIPSAAPDLSNREFLVPSLQVGGAGSSSTGGQQDIYRKLRKYMEASHKSSLKSKSSKHTPAMTDSLKKSSTLKSAKSSGLIF